MGDLDGKTFIVTGANAGIGRATAEALCARGARVHLACRSEPKTQPVLDALRAAHGDRAAAFLQLDLADLASVRAAAKRYRDSGEPLHVLINNAGMGGVRGVTKDGYEVTVGTNHVGPFLFTLLLLPVLKATAPARVVFVASRTHLASRGVKFDELKAVTRTPTGVPQYAMSKLCNVLCARELGERLAGTGITTYSLHPGLVASDIWRAYPRPIMKLMLWLRGALTNEQGALTSLYCATSPDVASHTGRYYAKEREERMSDRAARGEQQRELWEWSEHEVGVTFAAALAG